MEKIGENTREKYDGYLRNENYKDLFRDFYYYNNEFDPSDKFNTNEKKFINPHININTNTKNNTIISNNETNNNRSNDKIRDFNNLDNKFSKIKLISSSGSSNSLLRHYRQSSTNNMSNNSTSSSSSTYIHKRSGSTTNLNY